MNGAVKNSSLCAVDIDENREKLDTFHASFYFVESLPYNTANTAPEWPVVSKNKVLGV